MPINNEDNKKKVRNKVVVSLVMLKSKPPKNKEIKGNTANCSKGLKRFNINQY